MIRYVGIFLGIFTIGVVAGLGLGLRLRVASNTRQEDPVTNTQTQILSMATQLDITPTPEPHEVTIMAVGDVMLSRSVDEQMKKREDWTWPWALTAAKLHAGDITVGNLEAPMLSHCPTMTNRMIFCAEDESVAGLTLSGFDVMSLANNHILNQGKVGIKESVRLLHTAGIVGVKEGEMKMVEKAGVKIGWLAYDDVSKRLELEAVKQEIASAAAQVDIVVGLVHWGIEYVEKPVARQVEVGHAMVEAGMKVIIGSHPHWTQTVEEYKDGLIFYSLGNFVFDQMWSEETRQGYAVNLQLKTTNLKDFTYEYELLPVKIFDYGQPRWVNENDN